MQQLHQERNSTIVKKENASERFRAVDIKLFMAWFVRGGVTMATDAGERIAISFTLGREKSRGGALRYHISIDERFNREG
jgi:hypothetical protein